MTRHELALQAVNRRLEQLRTDLLKTEGENSRRFLFQSLVVMLGIGEELNDYIGQVDQRAQRRHGELKQENETLGARHAELLNSGKALLEQFKANPADRELRKQIEAAQKQMEAIQKALRRGASTLQRELSPSLAMIDPLADGVRRLSEADQPELLKRTVKTLVEQVARRFSALRAKHVIDAEAWEASALSEIDQAVDFYDAFARAGYQAWLAIHLAALAVSDHPPADAAEATRQANEAVAARLNAILARFKNDPA